MLSTCPVNKVTFLADVSCVSGAGARVLCIPTLNLSQAESLTGVNPAGVLQGELSSLGKSHILGHFADFLS